MLLKWCTPYASKFGQLNSGHRPGKGHFLFQSQRKERPKNVQTTTQLHTSHTLVKKCSKLFKQGFNRMWTKNFHMFKLDLEKAEEPEIKLPTSARSSKKQEFLESMSGQFSSVQFSHSVVSNSLRPHESQHASTPCPSPNPGVHPNPCPSSWWCHPTS